MMMMMIVMMMKKRRRLEGCRWVVGMSLEVVMERWFGVLGILYVVRTLNGQLGLLPDPD